MEEKIHTTDDGLQMSRYIWKPDSPKAILVVAHGLAEHGRRYGRLAEHFLPHGWLVHAHDHRGHGRSINAAYPLGHFGDANSFELVADDVATFCDELRDEYRLPLILLGHSAGSFMVQHLLTRRPELAHAFVLSGTNGRPPAIAQAGRVLARVERARVGKRRSSAVLQFASFGSFNRGFEKRTECDWLSRDPAEVDKYIEDPLCGFANSTQAWVDLLDAMPRFSAPTAQRRIPKAKPVYVFAGTEDPVGDKGAGVRRLEQAYVDAGLKQLTTKLYAGGRHEMLNETNRDEVMNDLLGWCHAQLPSWDPAASKELT